MQSSHARVVVIGGGIVGCSVLYHLAKEGWTDCVLVEKGELTSGSTWHAVGAITHALASPAIARMAGYGIALYQALEAETGQSVSWHGCGSLRLAYTDDQLDALRAMASVGAALGHPMEIVGPERIRALHPFYRLDGVRAALHTPADGHVDPAGATFALAKGARAMGAAIRRRTRATGVTRRPSGEFLVATDQGDIVCAMVVNAGGTFARQIGSWVGLDLQIVAAAHQYLVTETVPEFAARGCELPLVRDGHEISAYFRQEQNAGLIGVYEKADPHLVWLAGTPWESENELFAPDLDAIQPSLEIALRRMPVLADKGIKTIVNGAITYVPDGTMLVGRAPGVPNYWCACGVPVGIAWGPGIGKYLAQTMVHGRADISLRAFDPGRFGAWAGYDYAVAKVREDYVLRHEVAFPGRDRPAARPVRTSALYQRLKAQGAVFEQLAGWERPYWFAHDRVPQAHREGFRRTAANAAIAAEVLAVRACAGVLDLSGFAKLEVSGTHAAALLDRLTTNRLPARDGGIALTYMLNDAGTIEAELTVTRLAADRFFVLFAALDELRVRDWIAERRRPGEDAAIANLSDDYGSLVVTGPRTRAVLQPLTAAPLADAAFAWRTAQELRIAGCAVRALRLSLAGELGWELHAPMGELLALYDAVRDAGAAHGLVDFGSAALNAMRFEKTFKGTRELNAAATPGEAGIDRFVRRDKPDFVGKAAVLRAGPAAWRCVALALDDAADADCHGGEAVLHHGRVVGAVSSGAWGPAVARSLAFATLEAACAVPDTALEVIVLGVRRAARVLAEAPYDPAGHRLRG